MQTHEGINEATLRPLAGAPDRHVKMTCSGAMFTAALYETGRLIAIVAHSDRDWISAQVESWLGSTS